MTQSPTASSTPAAAATSGNARKYFKALATNDEDALRDAAQNLAAPKSVAAAYALHLSTVTAADLDGGSSSDADTLKVSGGTYRECPTDGDDDCTKWSDVRISGGKVSNFTVNGVNITDRISLGSGDKVKVDDLATVRFVSAYKSVASKALFVTVEVKTKDESIHLNLCGTKYRSPSGRQATATNCGGPDDLGKHSNAHGYAAFKGAEPGGVATLDFYDSDYNDHFIKIKTR